MKSPDSDADQGPDHDQGDGSGQAAGHHHRESLVHIVDDPDLLEEYGRGLLADQERRKWDDHVRRCARCREGVEAEAALAAGVRRAGREEAKRRLRQLVLKEQQGEERVPWPRVWSIAAAIVILAGLGIVGRWLTIRPAGTQETLTEQRRDSSTPGHGSEGETGKKAPGSAAESAPNPQPGPSGLAEAPPPGGGKKVPTSSAPARPANAGANRRAKGESPEAQQSAVEEGTVRLAPAYESRAPEPPGALTRTVARIMDEGSAAAMSEPAPSLNALQAAKRGGARLSSGAVRPSSSDSVHVRIQIDPQRRQEPANLVSALVRFDTAGVQITLLVPQSDSILFTGPARAARVGADSVVMIVGTRRLSLHLPVKPQGFRDTRK